MTLSRRSILAGLAAVPALAAIASTTAAPAAAAASYATVILSPHQDDETLRLSGYLTFMADRGDHVALINATDGAATRVGKDLGLSGAEVTRIRDREQAHAWAHLTDGRGTTAINLGFPDGAADARKIHAAVTRALSGMSGRPECYVAAYPNDRAHSYRPSARGGDNHPDHLACVQAGRMLAADGVTVRYAIHPSQVHRPGGTAYDTTARQQLRVEAAVAAYKTIGQRSVPEEFRHVLDVRGRSVVSS